LERPPRGGKGVFKSFAKKTGGGKKSPCRKDNLLFREIAKEAWSIKFSKKGYIGGGDECKTPGPEKTESPDPMRGKEGTSEGNRLWGVPALFSTLPRQSTGGKSVADRGRGKGAHQTNPHRKARRMNNKLQPEKAQHGQKKLREQEKKAAK